MLLIPHYVEHPFYSNPALHLLYISDENRVVPFQNAIEQVVSEGCCVAEIGAGCGILSRAAARAGAKKVYAIEKEPEILRFAERVIISAGMQDSVSLIFGSSFSISLPEKVDVLIAEIIGGIGNDEGISSVIEDARGRFLKSGGAIIPKKIDVFICPVCAEEAYSQISSVYEKDLIVAPYEARRPFKAYYEIIGMPPSELLSKPERLDAIDLYGHTEIFFRRKFRFSVSRNARFTGFAAWFVTELTGDVILDTSPWAPPTCWGQSYFAIKHTVPVVRGDVIELIFSAMHDKQAKRPYYVWEGTVNRKAGNKKPFYESNFQGEIEALEPEKRAIG
ncbi:MAG: hypothetical protein C4520_17520 [Candidatus Abyssobacteria bacterium SURF_5]|uniref:Protein arginine N-methyltransferase domain-containing protein n=1 Tax=Abyssobacteria bacterium (strain SURF_5) TaxID=2093360 RepID=A0A3A4NIT4_ABYX5|nr:MAG: hypothetical protein C4520_17520 [Candidatus Abyssubacteria bacterium SURF_5]